MWQRGKTLQTSNRDGTASLFPEAAPPGHPDCNSALSSLPRRPRRSSAESAAETGCPANTRRGGAGSSRSRCARSAFPSVLAMPALSPKTTQAPSHLPSRTFSAPLHSLRPRAGRSTRPSTRAPVSGAGPTTRRESGPAPTPWAEGGGRVRELLRSRRLQATVPGLEDPRPYPFAVLHTCGKILRVSFSEKLCHCHSGRGVCSAYQQCSRNPC